MNKTLNWCAAAIPWKWLNSSLCIEWLKFDCRNGWKLVFPTSVERRLQIDGNHWTQRELRLGKEVKIMKREIGNEQRTNRRETTLSAQRVSLSEYITPTTGHDSFFLFQVTFSFPFIKKRNKQALSIIGWCNGFFSYSNLLVLLSLCWKRQIHVKQYWIIVIGQYNCSYEPKNFKTANAIDIKSNLKMEMCVGRTCGSAS